MKAYGILGLMSELEDVVGTQLPVMVDAVFLPFNGKIVYDGLSHSCRISFGGGIRRSMANDCQEAKARFGIITYLPYSATTGGQSDVDRLKFSLKSQSNRERYQDEIRRLYNKSSDLRTVYHQEMGRIHARNYGKRLREMGITGGWFAIIRGLTIAAGTTRAEWRGPWSPLCPRTTFAYIFQVKG